MMSTNTSELLPTRQTLLSRLRDRDDQTSWREFFDQYWQLIYGLAKRRGLTDDEAQEALQETLIALAQTMPRFRYEPSKCSFKSWLRHLAEKKIADQFRRRARAAQAVHLAAGDDSALDVLANVPSAEPPPDAAWDEAWKRHLMETAIERVKAQVSAQQFQIFHRAAVLGFPAAEVARTLDVGLAQVYLAKHRVSAAVKKEVRKLERELG